jgi:hypothetical protein
LSSIEHVQQQIIHVKEEIIDSSPATPQPSETLTSPITLTLKMEPVPASTNILSSPPISGNRRAFPRQVKRRTLRESSMIKDTPVTMKKKARIDNGNTIHTDNLIDTVNSYDQPANRSNSTEQQLTESTAGKYCDFQVLNE